MTHFILASASPQRKEIFEDLGIDFTVLPSDLDESEVTESDPVKRALILAEEKARVVAQMHPNEWVIGCDTLVVSADGELLEKPTDALDVERMLRLHSGRISVVHSGLCIMRMSSAELASDVHTSLVTFKELSDEDIAWWIERGLWKDRSGAFQIDGDGQKLIDHLDGEFESVVGFPVGLFNRVCEVLRIENN